MNGRQWNFLRLRRRDGYLTRTFSKPLSNVQCSFYQLDVNQSYTIPGTKGKLLANNENLSPMAHCGVGYILFIQSTVPNKGLRREALTGGSRVYCFKIVTSYLHYAYQKALHKGLYDIGMKEPFNSFSSDFNNVSTITLKELSNEGSYF